MRLRLSRMSKEIQPEPAAERRRNLHMSEMATDDIRVHSEAPAEGDTSREFPEIRFHSQDPAEGRDGVAEPDANKQGPTGP